MWYMFYKYSSAFSHISISATPDVNEMLLSNKNFENCAVFKVHKNCKLMFVQSSDLLLCMIFVSTNPVSVKLDYYITVVQLLHVGNC
jgi:hypothetical protein